MSAIDWILEADGIPGRLTRLAATSEGMFTFQQAGRAGITPENLREQAAAGVLEEWDEHYIYRHLGHHGPWHEDFYREAWLRLHPSQFADERTGQYREPRELITGLWALSMQGDYLPAFEAAFLMVEQPPRDIPHADVIVHDVLADDWTWVRGLPVTRPTVALADMVLLHEDEETIAESMHEAIRQGLFNARRFIDLISPVADLYQETPGDGRAVLERLFGRGATWISLDGVTTTSAQTSEEITVTSHFPLTQNGDHPHD